LQEASVEGALGDKVQDPLVTGDARLPAEANLILVRFRLNQEWHVVAVAAVEILHHVVFLALSNAVDR
jgi:hypothetical protein